MVTIKTQNMTLALHLHTDGCTFLLKLMIWHIKAYAAIMSCLSQIRLRKRMHIHITLHESREKDLNDGNA